jgi:uncharacterized caspase-like protein
MKSLGRAFLFGRTIDKKANMSARPSYSAKYANSWAIVLGINGYEQASPLTYAVNDADAVAAILPSLGFPASQTVLLKDRSATREAILRAYLDLYSRAHSDDRILIFFAGHGHTIESARGPVGFLVPVDGQPDSLATLIRWDDLTRNADLLVAKHML